MSAQKVPLIETQAMSEFGDLRDQAAFYNPDGMDRDHTYVPGFSEMRRTVAIQMAEVKKGVRAVKDVQTLPVNLRWARGQDVQGRPDSTKQFGHGRKGYRLANGNTKEKGGDVGNDWLKELPPGTQLMADGTIRNGDAVLMVCDKDQAARNEFNKRRLTEERVKGAEGAFARMVETARGVNPGAAPYMKIEPATAPAKR